MAIVAIKELRKACPPKTRLLGLDISDKNLGLALSNPEWTLATPLKTLKRTKFLENIAELAAFCREYGIGGFVIGLPLNMDDSEGPRAQAVRHYAMNLIREKTALGFTPAIAFQDERLSTFAAEDFLSEHNRMDRQKRAEIIDALAAAHILQAALDILSRPPVPDAQ